MDEYHPFLEVLILILLLIISAIFSGAEAAFLAIDEKDLENPNDKNEKFKRIEKLAKDPQRLYVALTTGKIISNITFVIIFYSLVWQLTTSFELNSYIPIVSTIFISAILIAILSELIPKIIALNDPMSFAEKTSFAIIFFQIPILPFSELINLLTGFAGNNFDFGLWRKHISEDDLKVIVGVDQEQGENLEDEEREMIHSIFGLGETTVKEIMIPRIDIVCVEMSSTISQVVEAILENGFSRMPVYEEKIDNIKGVLYSKDLLQLMGRNDNKTKISEIVRPATFVPESKMVDDLLREFKKDKVHMAIVVDEYGGTSGLVTLEDVIEEIVGEIQDEYDNEDSLFEEVDENTFIFNAKIEIEDANKVLESNFAEDEEFETLGGLIYDITGSVPNKGDVINFENFEFKIIDVDNRRVSKVKVTKVPLNDENSDLT
ncbi:MAG: HlyC/CorC family transporter [Calditrichaeota bacterium]|nr:MAG: HlyC/CorC family transporter [Calditrichota bacterium]